jgi:hypothetical protein
VKVVHFDPGIRMIGGGPNRARNREESMANWEMGQIYQAGQQGSVTFMQGGQAVRNPFQ